MFVKGLRKFLYAGALLALAPILAIAEAEPIAAPANAGAGSAAPATCKVRVCEMVAEPCEYTRTTYKPVTTEETYTAYRCETVNETKTKQVTVYRKVCETVNETRTITKRVPCWEERTEMVSKWKCQQVTEMKSRTVHGGHWECCTSPAGHSVLDRLCGKCPDPCATKTSRKWVSDCHTECVPVCHTKLVKVCEPVCKKVCTYKCVTETVCCPVTRTRCVPETKTCTYTECRKISVPYQAKRCVTKCVPVCETVKGTRMVAKWVEKEVAAAPCATACDSCGEASRCGRGGLKGRFASRGGHSRKGCGSACGVAASCCN